MFSRSENMFSKTLIGTHCLSNFACTHGRSNQPSRRIANCTIITRSKLKAFTIIELLITLTILSISLSIAIPSFNSFIDKTKLKTSALSLHATLTQARNHAISNQVTVIVCQANDNNYQQCSPTRERYDNWQNGWISYADLNKNNELDTDDQILTVRQALSQTAVVFNQVGRLRFFPLGSARSAGFYICSSNSSQTQYIRLLHTGRSRMSQDLNPDQLLKCQNQIKN